MLLKETIENIDDEDVKKKKSIKKKKGIFSSLLGEIINSKENTTDEKPSFYDKDSSFFTDDDFDDLDIVKSKEQKPRAFNFNWWEYAIIFTELILLIYAILVFLNQVPIF